MAEKIAERALVDALDEPAIIVEGATVTFANASARRLLGSGIEGRDVRLANRHPQALERILGRHPGDLDATGIVEPGRSWRLLIRPLAHQSVLVRMIDRSDAVSAEKMRVDFVANASHELRTPLSTVIGYAETLADSSDLSPETLSSFGRTVRDEAQRMLRIIEDLMSLSRIEADRFIAPNEEVRLQGIIAAAIGNVAAARGQCEIAVDLPETVAAVRGDPAQLAQVIDNLLSNAIRYGCSGPSSKIDVKGRQDESWVSFSIQDYGPGIPREHLPRLTERFYRVDDARSRETGGTGLGLAIVKHIIERHRGTLDIKSTVGVGTIVTIRLPVAR